MKTKRYYVYLHKDKTTGLIVYCGKGFNSRYQDYSSGAADHIYIILRIVMFVLVEYFDFTIYSRTLEANLWDQAWTWFIVLITRTTLIPIEDASLKENYTIYKFLYPSYDDELVLVATVYKEHHPLLYKTVEETRETFSKTKDMKTITLFNEDKTK